MTTEKNNEELNLIDKIKSRSGIYSISIALVVLSFFLTILIVDSIMLGDSLIYNIFSAILISIIIGAIPYLLTYNINYFKQKCNIGNTFKKVISIICILLIGFGLYSQYLIDSKQIKMAEMEKQQKKQTILEAQKKYDSLTPEEKEQRAIANKKAEEEKLENEKISKMSDYDKTQYLEEKEKFAGMSEEEITKIKDAEALAKKRAEDQIKVAAVTAGMLKQGMTNPDSFKLKKVIIYDDYTFCYTYQGTNSFNAIIQQDAIFTNKLELLTESDGNKFVSRWNKLCTRSEGRDKTRLVLIEGGL